MNEPVGRYVTLDGLRGVAALAIAMCHMPQMFNYGFENTTMAVDFFFALSGFVIAHAYGERLAGGLGAVRFFRLRMIRLYPLYLLGSVIGVGAWTAGILPEAEGVAPFALPLGALMLPTLAGVILYPFNGPAWSLFFELVANAAYGVFHRWTRHPLLLAGGIAVCALALIAFVVKFETADLGWQTGKEALGGFAKVGFSFLAGIAVYRLHRWKPVSLPIRPWMLGAALFALMMVPARPWIGAYQTVCILLVLPVLLYVGAGLKPGRVEGAVFSFLGATSYALYAIHMPLFKLLEKGLAMAGVQASSFAPVSGLMFLGIALAAAHAADLWYDGPVRRTLNGWERTLSRKPALT